MIQVNDDIAKQVLSTNLKKLLAEKKWSLRRLARESGDPVMTIHNVISGRNLPTAGILVRMADALGVTIDELFNARRKTEKSA